jgi:glutamyl-tRNA synthetase
MDYNNHKIITRFAPSPTGYLHIGGARTALFNWLFARHHGGEFQLRIEDTDRARSTDDAIAAIIEGMNWLGLNWDGEIVYQFQRAARHAEVARQMLDAGNAYYCYTTPEELELERQKAKDEGRQFRYNGFWRDKDGKGAPVGVSPVIRLKAPQSGSTVVEDMVQGRVEVQNQQLDDMILLRSDGTPTYMLAVVVDDHDMGVTHIIRGDDHLNNAFRQAQIYTSMGWQIPIFAHIPLIHGADGAKLSKRHGALGVDAYRDMGMLPEAMRNYLLRLGWSHGDDEIIPTDKAIEWFNLESVGRSPARFDMKKLESVNAYYIAAADDDELIDLLKPICLKLLGYDASAEKVAGLKRGLATLKPRASNLNQLAEEGLFYLRNLPIPMNDKAKAVLNDESVQLLSGLKVVLEQVADDEWNNEFLKKKIYEFAEQKGKKLGDLGLPLRAKLTGSTSSPGIFEVMEALGKTESLIRIS